MVSGVLLTTIEIGATDRAEQMRAATNAARPQVLPGIPFPPNGLSKLQGEAISANDAARRAVGFEHEARGAVREKRSAGTLTVPLWH